MMKDLTPSLHGTGLNSDCWSGPESVTVEVGDANFVSDIGLLLLTSQRMMPTWAFEPSNSWCSLSPTYVFANFDDIFTHINSGSILKERAYPEWFCLAHGKEGPLTLTELGVIVDGITRDLYAKNFESIDEALGSAEPSLMSNDAIVAVARVTYTARHALATWPTFVRRSKKALSDRGQSEKMMAGL